MDFLKSRPLLTELYVRNRMVEMEAELELPAADDAE